MADGGVAMFMKIKLTLRLPEGARLRIGVWAVAVAFGLMAAGFGAAKAQAQARMEVLPAPEALPGTNGTAELVAQLQGRITDAQTDLNRALATMVGSTNLPPGATPPEAIEYGGVLRRLVRTYQLHLDDLVAMEAVRQRQQELERTAKFWTGFPEPPPYSVLFVDDLRDAVQSLEAKVLACATTLDVVEGFISEARNLVKESDEQLRRVNEQLETAKVPAAVTRLNWLRELEQARSRVATAVAASFETKRRKANVELAESRQRLAFARRQLAQAAPQVRFSQRDLDTVLGSIESERLRLEEQVRTTSAELERRQKALAEAREQLRVAGLDAARAATNAAGLRQLEQIVDVRSTQARTEMERLTVIRQLLDGTDTERQLWQMRFTLFGSRDFAELQKGYRRLEWLAGLLTATKPHFSQQIAAAANQITEQQNRLQNGGLAGAELALARERLETFQARAEFYGRGLLGLEKRERLILRWKESLDADRRALPLSGRFRDLFAGASGFVSKFWNFELFAVEDTIAVDGQQITGRRSVTIGKVLLAVLILVVGYWLSNILARVLERLAVRRLKVEKNQANLVRRWVRVVLVLGLVVFSLVSVKIPLTIFAFAGGALAIGVGFGTQNLLKNFISGIIILFERPFRVGDVLDVGGQRGTVTSIGIRSSVLQLWDYTEMLIPNSALLENNLTNWTYSNRAVRFTVPIGVAYGSDTRRVAQLLADVAGRHGQVQKEPKPQVLFQDFGASSLNFEVRYWVDVLNHNASQVASDLRHMIASALAESGVVIAFPQQDVHLDTARPLQVQVVPPGEIRRPDQPPAGPASA